MNKREIEQQYGTWTLTKEEVDLWIGDYGTTWTPEDVREIVEMLLQWERDREKSK